MTRSVVLLAGALVALSLAGCPSAERPAGPVQPGAFCDTPGASGRTKAGTEMECKGPGELRWRQAGGR